MKLSEATLRNIGESIILTEAKLRHMRQRDKELFLVGMAMASIAYAEGITLEQAVDSRLKPNIAKHKMVLEGATAMQRAIEKGEQQAAPVRGSNTAFTVVATKRVPVDGKIEGESLVVGTLPSMEHVNELVRSGGLPPDYQFYAVMVVHVNFYVLVSNEFSSEQIHEMSMKFSNDSWTRLQIWSGPHSTPEQAEASLKSFDGSFKGAHLASMTDADAAKLKRIGRSVQ